MNTVPLSILDVLTAFIRLQVNGAVLDWTSVEQATGVAMDRVGRSTLRRACQKAGRNRENIPGRLGIILSSPTNAEEFSRNKSLQVVSKARQAQAFTSSLLREHDEGLTSTAKQNLIRNVAILGSVGLAIAHRVALPKPANALALKAAESDKAAE